MEHLGKELLVGNLEQHFDIDLVEDKVEVGHTYWEEYIPVAEQIEAVEVVCTVVVGNMGQKWGCERDLIRIEQNFDFGIRVVHFDGWFRILSFARAVFCLIPLLDQNLGRDST